MSEKGNSRQVPSRNNPRAGKVQAASTRSQPRSSQDSKVTYKGEVPDQDVHEDMVHSPPPSAPPLLSEMDYLNGYEDTQFRSAFIPPPPYEPRDSRQSRFVLEEPDILRISEDKARLALFKEVDKNCCFGKKAVDELVFTSLVPSNAYHYQLNTFTESRKTAWAYTPYTRQRIDGPQNGVTPGPWNINVQPKEMFKDHEKEVEVPHTASVKVCHGCSGGGMNRCWKCLGRGRVICSVCDGSGRQRDPQLNQNQNHHYGGNNDASVSSCSACLGSGRKRCLVCIGCGQTACTVCEGKKKLKCYIKLTVTWRNNREDHVAKRTDLPDHLIEEGLGRKTFQDTQSRVFPVTGFPDNRISRASQRLIDSHAVRFPREHILSQQHWIRIIPVTEAHCCYKSKPFSYFIYGDNSSVHAPDYPERNCCTLL